MSQRSGFHSYASSPQSALFVLDDITPMKTDVSFGSGISVMSVPSRPRTGSDRGRTTSSRVLHPNYESISNANPIQEPRGGGEEPRDSLSEP